MKVMLAPGHETVLTATLLCAQCETDTTLWLCFISCRWQTCAGGTTYQNSQNLWTLWVPDTSD